MRFLITVQVNTMKLGIVTSHPIQYYAPWFRYLSIQCSFSVKVFYLWDFGIRSQPDPGFNQELKWDLPLTEGYDFSLVQNVASDPGTHHFSGLNNPTLQCELETFSPDAILLIGYNYLSMFKLMISPRFRHIPFILRGDSHLLAGTGGLKAVIKKIVLTGLFKRFSAVLYVGEANRRYFLKYNVSDHRLFLAPHAVDNERFFACTEQATQAALQWRKQLNIGVDDLIIMFAGKFEDKKRPLDLARAFQNAEIPDAHLVFVGGGILQPEIEALAAHNGKIHILPFQNQSAMPGILSASDLVVLPSSGNYETWGLIVNEAFCMGKAVIVSDQVGCAGDLVQSRINGLIFPAGNVESLSNCLSEAVADRDRLKMWGAQGKKIVSAFSYAEATAGLQKALEACVSSGVAADE